MQVDAFVTEGVVTTPAGLTTVRTTVALVRTPAEL
jgi:hypothetical protein